METCTWRHGHGDMARRHGHGEMARRNGHGDIEISNGKRKPKIFSVIRLPFAHCAHTSLSFVLFRIARADE
jgi:hypothetical protein